MTRLKNVVIFALVIVNALFLFFFLGRLINERSDKKEALMNLSDLFEANDIHIDIVNIREGGEFAGLLTSRDAPEERKLAERLLGQSEVTENGGIYTYTGKNGQAVFRSGGTFEVTFSENVYNSISGARSTAKSLLQIMGVETGSLDVAGDQENETVDAMCSWDRQPIFNCRIKFVFKDGSLVKISGRYAEISVTTGRTDMSSCAMSMMYFLNEVRNDRISCSQILKVEPGYKLNVSGDVISAVWRVATDTGVSYYIDPVTGNIEPETQ